MVILDSPFGIGTALATIVDNFIADFQPLITALAVAALIICGIKYFFAGSAQEVAQVKKTIIYIVIGLLLILLAKPIVDALRGMTVPTITPATGANLMRIF